MSHVPPTLKEEVKQGLPTSENLGGHPRILPTTSGHLTFVRFSSKGSGERDAEAEGQAGFPPLAHQWGSRRREPGQGQLLF